MMLNLKLSHGNFLRQLETHESFNKATCHVFRDAVKDIVGVQLRNLATIGGSVYSRFSFSDVICSLLCLECDVYKHMHMVVFHLKNS